MSDLKPSELAAALDELSAFLGSKAIHYAALSQAAAYIRAAEVREERVRGVADMMGGDLRAHALNGWRERVRGYRAALDALAAVSK